MRNVMFVSVLAVVLLAGCGGSEQSPSVKYVNTANFAADRFEEMAVLAKLGAFNDAQLKDIKFWTDQAKFCLDEWYINVKTDPNAPAANFDTADAYGCVRNSLLNLLVYEQTAPAEMQREAFKNK